MKEAQLVGNETINTSFGSIELEESYLTPSSIQALNSQLDLQRAVEVYQWSLALTTFGMWYNAHYQVYNASDLDFVKYKTFNEKAGMVTANSSTPYVIAWLDLARTGPVVIDYPKGPSAGTIMSFFQLSIADLSFTGPDKGKGGKYNTLRK